MRKKLFKRLAAAGAVASMLAASMSVFAAESYTVQSGDNLKKIAKQLYGDSSKWEAIYEANKGSIKNPNLIYEGQVFAIPDSDAASASGAETPAADTAAPAPAPEAEAPAADTAAPAPAPEAQAPAADAAAPAPTLASLPIPPATVSVEKGGGFDMTGSGSSIWTQTYDSSINRTGGHIGWDGKLVETMTESTDAYGVTYRSYAFNDSAKNVQSAKDALAGYMAENPDSALTAFVKASGSELVIATYPALFPNGMEGLDAYPDGDLLAWDYFLVDGKLYILGADNTFDWLEGTPRPDLYIPQYLNSAFYSISNMLK